MAQFVEVMKQAKRMCTAHGSMCSTNNCQLDSGEACRLNVDLDGEDYNELERIIMDWAAGHPEPVYPSWEEGWRQLFPDAKCTPCPDNFGFRYSVPNCAYLACADCKSTPMPAEVAEKLGIKPIAHQSEDVHNGCVGCKYGKRSVYEELCAQCRGWEMITSNTNKRGDLWEAAK